MLRAMRALTADRDTPWLRPVCSPSHLVPLGTEGFSEFVTSTTAPIATGGSNFAGWDSHPLESRHLSWRTSNSGAPDLGTQCSYGRNGISDYSLMRRP